MLPAITSTLRHFLGTLLGAWVSKGIITGDQVTIITDAVTAIVGIALLVGWSLIEKKLLKKKDA